MATGAGINSFISLGEESTYGTAVSTTDHFRLISEAITVEDGYNLRPYLSTAVARQKIRNRRNVSGSFTIPASYGGMGLLLKHVLGDVSTAGAGPYTHTITDATLPTGLTIQVDRDSAGVGGSSAFRYAGCQISSFTMSQSMEEEAQISCDILGKVVTNESAATPSYPAAAYADWTGVTASSLDGNAFTARELEVSIQNELRDGGYKLGTRERQHLGRKGGTVTMKFNGDFDGLDFFTDYIGGSTGTAVATWSDGTNSVSFSLANACVQNANPTASDPDDIVYDVEIEGDLGDLTVTLINSDSSY